MLLEYRPEEGDGVTAPFLEMAPEFPEDPFLENGEEGGFEGGVERGEDGGPEGREEDLDVVPRVKPEAPPSTLRVAAHRSYSDSSTAGRPSFAPGRAGPAGAPCLVH